MRTQAQWHKGECMHLSKTKSALTVSPHQRPRIAFLVMVETFELLKIVMLPSCVQAVPKSV